MEALLFAADEPLSARALADMVGVETKEVRDSVRALREEYDTTDRGICIIDVAGGYRLVTKPEWAPYVAKLHRPRRIRMTRAALETLAIIAYRQPLTQPEIDHLRGVNSSGVLETLVERDLVRVIGRRESPGRPYEYGTTEAFLDHFGLRSLKDLPDLPDAELTDELRALIPPEELAGVDELPADEASLDDDESIEPGPAGEDAGHAAEEETPPQPASATTEEPTASPQ